MRKEVAIQLAELITKRSLVYLKCSDLAKLVDAQSELMEINKKIQELRVK